MTEFSRRRFLKTSATAGAGLILGFSLAGCSDDLPPVPTATFRPTLAPDTPLPVPTAMQFNGADGAFVPGVWLRIAPDNSITITVAKSEMGQGVRTTMAMLVADELEADWSKVKIEQALGNATTFGNMSTGGSTSTRQNWSVLRQAGATAREMLLAAAAQTWGVNKATLKAENSTILNPANGTKLSYGELANTAAKMTLPTSSEIVLKDPVNYHIIGKRIPRVDATGLVDGSAKFGLDIRVPNMLYAVVERSPVFGGKLISFNDTEATKIAGVKQIFKIDNGVAVVAENTWAAIKGREALKINWDYGTNSTLSSDSIRKQMQDKIGQLREVPSTTARKLEASYEVPFLAHAPMEPLNCVADVRADKCELWVSIQDPREAQIVAAQAAGVSATAVKVNVTLLGGGFGRRLTADFVAEAVKISKAINTPVKLLWTRADDLQHDYYRPASLHVMRGGIDSTGRPVGYVHRVVGLTLTIGGGAREMLNGAIPPYNFPSPSIDTSPVTTPVPTMSWRSVYNSQNVFANECFMDEMAVAAGKDPYEYRQGLIREPRLKAVLETVATKAEWSKPLPTGQGRGIACFSGFGSFAAHVVELSYSKEAGLKILRVVAAVDCGVAINPSIIEAQIEGGIMDGISTALKAAITIENGRVKQSNFNDYEWARISDTPTIEVYIIPSKLAPGGLGEVGFPSVSPAIANAIFAATGKRLRRLPIRPADLG